MSTRSTTHFYYAGQDKPKAIVYRHPDGYPEGAGADLLKFIDECKALHDPRFGDPSYLAAKYVVFLADIFNYAYSLGPEGYGKKRPASRLEFLSVGVVMEDPGDIEYRYVVTCDGLPHGSAPKIQCFRVSCNDADDSWKEKEEASRE